MVGVDGMKVTRQSTVSSPTVRVDREREDAEFRWLLGKRSGFGTTFVLTEDYGLYSNRYEQLVSVMRIALENGLKRTAKFFYVPQAGECNRNNG